MDLKSAAKLFPRYFEEVPGVARETEAVEDSRAGKEPVLRETYFCPLLGVWKETNNLVDSAGYPGEEEEVAGHCFPEQLRGL